MPRARRSPVRASPSLPDREAFAALKDRSVLELLFRTARRTNEVALEELRALTGLAIRPAHTALFPHLDLEGTRLTTLAARLGVSKQAAGQLVEELVQMGVLDKVDDPEDGRARRIVFADGDIGLRAGLAHLIAFEASLREEVGDRRMNTLRATLTRVLDAVEARARDVDGDAP